MIPEFKKCLQVLFVRHGETEDNKTRIIAGHLPGKLTPLGRTQAQKIGAFLTKDKRQFSQIYLSDLGRTKETFQYATKMCPYLKKITTSFTPMLRGKCGVLQGKPHSAWQQEAQKNGKDIRSFKFEGGESQQDVNKRCSEFLKFLICTHFDLGQKKSNNQTKILVVTHGGFIKQFIYLVKNIQGQEVKFQNTAKNCSFNEFMISFPGSVVNFAEKQVQIEQILKNFLLAAIFEPLTYLMFINFFLFKLIQNTIYEQQILSFINQCFFFLVQ